MSTQSIIAYKTPEGKFRGIHCHWDGYIEHNGRILKEHYTDLDKIKSLVDFGFLSSLAPNVHPTSTAHSWANPEKDVCVFYTRDRGEEWKYNKPVEGYTLSQMVRDICDVSYVYVFDNGKWLCNGVEMSG